MHEPTMTTPAPTRHIRTTLIALTIGATLAGAGAVAHAQDAAAARKLQMQLQRTMQEKAAAEREKAELAAKLKDAEGTAVELDGTRKQLAAAKREATVARKVPDLERRLAQTQDAQARLERELETARSTAQLQAKRIEELTARVAAADQRGKQLDGTVAAGRSELEACSARNRTLVETGREIVDSLADGRCAARARWDPVLQFGRVQFEQRLEAYRDRIAEARYAPASNPSK